MIALMALTLVFLAAVAAMCAVAGKEFDPTVYAPLADPDSRPSLAEQVRALPESEWERRHVAEALAVADFHNDDRFFDALADERDQLGGVA